MHHGFGALFGKDPRQQRAILDIALVEGHVIGYRKAEAGRQVVDYRNRRAAIAQRQRGMASDLTGTAGNENGCIEAHGSSRNSIWQSKD